nr:zinc-binding dehydrogenase [Moraxella oblonga]
MPTKDFAKEMGLSWWKQFAMGLISAKIHKTAHNYGTSYEFLFMKPSGKELNIIKTWAEVSKLRPIIDQVFAFDDTQKALEYSESGRAKGKIVIEMG